MFIGSMNANATDDCSAPRIVGHVLCRLTIATGQCAASPTLCKSIGHKSDQIQGPLAFLVLILLGLCAGGRF
eukprot:3047278-Rhodomonas_salina.1